MKTTRWKFGLLALIASLSACNAARPTAQNSPAATDSESLKVVATSSVLCDMAETIAAQTIDLTCLIKAGADPHVYEPTPNDRRAIEEAQVIFYLGYDFEPSLIRLIKASSNSAPKVAVGEVAIPDPLMGEHDHADGEQHDSNHTHAEGKTPDPHVWHSAENGIRMVEVVEKTLAEAAPAHANLYAQNAQALTAELGQINAWIKSQIATIPASSRKLVTTHDALGYYADAYGIPVEGALQGLSTQEQPSAARVRELTEEIQASQVPTIFAETAENTKLLDTVAQAANVKISDRQLFADGLGAAGSTGDTYPKMLLSNTQAIVEGLGGKFTPFQLK